MNLRIITLVSLAMASAISPGASANEGPSERVDEQRQERADYRQTLDTIMREEGRDASWADVVETQLNASLDAVSDYDVSVVDLVCGSTLCRVVLDHNSLDGQQEVLRETSGSPGFRLAGKAHLEWDDDGSARTYVYLLRSEEGGWPLPPSVIR